MYKYGCNYEHEVFKTTEVLEINELMTRISKELWTTLDSNVVLITRGESILFHFLQIPKTGSCQKTGMILAIKWYQN